MSIPFTNVSLDLGILHIHYHAIWGGGGGRLTQHLYGTICVGACHSGFVVVMSCDLLNTTTLQVLFIEFHFILMSIQFTSVSFDSGNYLFAHYHTMSISHVRQFSAKVLGVV